jgi:hypothetical protein
VAAFVGGAFRRQAGKAGSHRPFLLSGRWLRLEAGTAIAIRRRISSGARGCRCGGSTAVIVPADRPDGIMGASLHRLICHNADVSRRVYTPHMIGWLRHTVPRPGRGRAHGAFSHDLVCYTLKIVVCACMACSFRVALRAATLSPAAKHAGLFKPALAVWPVRLSTAGCEEPAWVPAARVGVVSRSSCRFVQINNSVPRIDNYLRCGRSS